MRRCALPIAVLLLLVFAIPVFAEWELGASFTPYGGGDSEYADQTSFFDEAIKGVHFGYVWWRIAYATWDSLIMPVHVVEGMTSRYDPETGFAKEGIPRPGFLNLYDVGARLLLGPFVVSAQVGVNQLYVYKQEELPDFDPQFGANLRIGAGLVFDWWGISIAGTSVFPNFEDVVSTLGGLAGSDFAREKALEKIASGLVPTIHFTMYLK
jgi:hypothetical protein